MVVLYRPPLGGQKIKILGISLGGKGSGKLSRKVDGVPG